MARSGPVIWFGLGWLAGVLSLGGAILWGLWRKSDDIAARVRAAQ